MLACDFQGGILGFLPADVLSGVLDNAKKALRFAQENNLPVIHIRVAFQPGYPEINMRNPVCVICFPLVLEKFVVVLIVCIPCRHLQV